MDKNLIIFKVDRLYAEEGYKVLHIPDFKTHIKKNNSKNALDISYGIHPTDIQQFIEISKRFKVKSVFIIGNAFGYSTFCLAEIFKNSFIDVIDAEIKGKDNWLGSQVTRKIIRKYYPKIRLTIGFSPKDIHKSKNPRVKSYDFVFIDGKHTNYQLLADFMGIAPYLSKRCVVYLHDIKLCNLYKGFEIIAEKGKEMGFDLFIPVIQQTDIPVLERVFKNKALGAGIVIRSVPLLKRYFGKKNR